MTRILPKLLPSLLTSTRGHARIQVPLPTTRLSGDALTSRRMRRDGIEKASEWSRLLLRLHGALSRIKRPPTVSGREDRKARSSGQIGAYQDSDLERLYVFLRHLTTKLPKRGAGPTYQFDEAVRLEYYRLQKISEVRSASTMECPIRFSALQTNQIFRRRTVHLFSGGDVPRPTCTAPIRRAAQR